MRSARRSWVEWLSRTCLHWWRITVIDAKVSFADAVLRSKYWRFSILCDVPVNGSRNKDVIARHGGKQSVRAWWLPTSAEVA